MIAPRRENKGIGVSESAAIVQVLKRSLKTKGLTYKDIAKRKNLKQNIELKPGDTVIVP